MTHPGKGGILGGHLARGGEDSDRCTLFDVMFDKAPEYSSDVEWLLQDKQAKVNSILTVMVPEHFERTLRLAFLISMDPEVARLATCETFANALISRHRYSSDQEVQEWLDQILITTCQEYLSGGNSALIGAKPYGKDPISPGWGLDDEIEMQLWRSLNALPFSERLPFMLYSIFSFPVPQVARLLGLREEAADSRLEAARLEILAGLNGKAGADSSLNGEKISSYLTRTFQERWESGRLIPEGMDGTIAAIRTMVELKHRERRRRVILQEILLVAIVIVLVITLIQASVTLSADPNASQISPVLQSYLSAAGVSDLRIGIRVGG